MQTWGANCFASPSNLTQAGRNILAAHPDSPGSLGIAISEAAATLGAKVIERHITLDRTMTGPDHAISLEPHEVVNLECDPTDPAKHIERRYMTDDPAWLNGPPYAVVEEVFDEDSLKACSLTNIEMPDDAPMSDAAQ